MKKYTVACTDWLRTICINHNWFTCGSNAQYEKLFYANEMGASIEEIATIIWLCSEGAERRDILYALQKLKEYYVKAAGEEAVFAAKGA